MLCCAWQVAEDKGGVLRAEKAQIAARNKQLQNEAQARQAAS